MTLRASRYYWPQMTEHELQRFADKYADKYTSISLWVEHGKQYHHLVKTPEMTFLDGFEDVSNQWETIQILARLTGRDNKDLKEVMLFDYCLSGSEVYDLFRCGESIIKEGLRSGQYSSSFPSWRR